MPTGILIVPGASVGKNNVVGKRMLES